MRRLVASAKEARRTERQRISAWPDGRALVWVVVLTLLAVAAGIWVLAMILF